MPRLVNPSRVGGSLHDISTLQSLGTDPCNVLFVSDQVMYLLANYAVRDVGFYGRYVTEYLSRSQAIVVDPDDPEAPFIDRLVEDFQLQTAGDDLEIANALNNIAVALQAQQQCCDGPASTGTGGSGGQETTPSDGVDNGSVPPSTTSFPTYNEYLTYKCNVANAIVDDADATTNAMAAIAWGSLFGLPIAEIVVILAATWVTPVPGDEIIAMMAFLALWGGAFQPVFDNIEQAIDNHRQSLVCALYVASDPANAKEDYLDALYDAIDVESTPGSLLNTVSKGVAKIFVTFDNVNKLFTEDTSRTYPTGSIDCSTCPNICEMYFADDGTIQVINGLNVSVESADNGGTGRVELWLNTDGTDSPSRTICGPNYTFESIVLTTGQAGVILYDDAGVIVGNYHTDPANGNLPQVTPGVRHIDVNWNTGQGLPPAQASFVFS
jgi:hypothetical protein